ncbi:hypothetical protein TNCV_451701 [Trichonephila clavipes]|nr:hypothetical protein TNCV_451701 [Trichonephila clavipes]
MEKSRSLTRNYGALVQTAQVCICIQIGLERAEREFFGLPMRRVEGRVGVPPLVFKKVFFRIWEEKKPCPESRELEESAKERDFDRDWKEKEGKTMNAGGVEE